METENKSRFAELAVEMMGAQAAGRFLDDVWSHASSEVKKDLANKVITALAEQTINRLTDSFYSGQYTNSTIDKLVDTKAFEESHGPNIRKAFAAAFERLWPDAVERLARTALDNALKDVKEKFRW